MTALDEIGPDSGDRRFSHAIVAGVVAGLGSRVITHPFDTLKARAQVRGAVTARASQQTQASNVWANARSLLRSEGVAGFYRGFGAVVCGAVPAQAAYFGGYELGKRAVPRDAGVAGDMATGCIAQLIAGVAFTPVDILKERLQVHTLLSREGMQSTASLSGALQRVWHAKGARGLLQGYWATNCVWLPWNVVYIASYEGLRKQAHQALAMPPQDTLPAHVTAGAALVAASGAVIVTHPPDVIKTRLQVLPQASGQPAATFVSIALDLLRKEGVPALWHGLGARLLTIGPGAALSWTIYEEVHRRLRARR